MVAKEVKRYQTLKNCFDGINAKNGTKVIKAFVDMLEVDYAYAVELWEYLLTDYENKIMTESDYALLFVDKVAELLLNQANAKMLRTFADNSAIRTAYFKYSPSCFKSEFAVGYLCNNIVLNKFEIADGVLKSIIKNTNSTSDYASYLLAVTEMVIQMVAIKSPTVLIRKKISNYILSYSDKLKGGEKALISQRLNEIL